MALRQRGEAWQVDVAYSLQGKRCRYRKQHDSKMEAEQDELRAKGCILRNESPDVSPKNDGSIATMQQAYDGLWEREWKHQKAARTHETNGTVVVQTVGPDRHPSAVTTRVVDACVAEWEKLGNSGATINRKLSSLSKLLKFAKSRGAIAVMPDLTRRKESEGRIRWYTAEEEATIIGYFKHFGRPEMADYLTFLIDTGLRADKEALRLRWVDVVDKQVRLHGDGTKNGKGRVVPQTVRIQAMLKRRSEACPAGVDRVWYDIETYSHARHCWDRMQEHLGYGNDPQFVIHACRHTFCSRLVQAGVPILTVMQLAGHSSVAVTQRYSHLHSGNLTDAIAALEPGGVKLAQEPVTQMRIAQ